MRIFAFDKMREFLGEFCVNLQKKFTLFCEFSCVKCLDLTNVKSSNLHYFTQQSINFVILSLLQKGEESINSRHFAIKIRGLFLTFCKYLQ